MRAKLLPYSTFIGYEVEVINATNPSLIGIKGKVVDETKNLLIVKTEKKEVKVPKNNAVFRFYLNNEYVDVSGWAISFRPHERPKKVKEWRLLSP